MVVDKSDWSRFQVTTYVKHHASIRLDKTRLACQCGSRVTARVTLYFHPESPQPIRILIDCLQGRLVLRLGYRISILMGTASKQGGADRDIFEAIGPIG